MPIELNVGSKFDEGSARRIAEEGIRYYERHSAQMAVQAKLDEQAARKVEGEAKAFYARRSADFKVEAKLDRDRAQKIVKEFNVQLKAQEPQINVGAELDKTSVLRAREEARILVGKDINVKVKVDNASVQNFARDSERAFSQASAAASAFGNVIESMGLTSTSGLGAGGPIIVTGMVAGFVELAGVAASAAQAIWLVPAALGAVGAAFATLQIGTAGFNTALDALFGPQTDASAKKLADSLQLMAPNAQQAVLSIQAMMPAFNELKNATGDALFAGVGQQLNALVNQYLPTIQTMTTGIADAFNKMFMGFSNQLMTPETQAAMQTFMQNTTAGFQALAPAIAPLTKAFADIMAVGSGFMPDLAKAAVVAANAFSQFITEAKQSGDLKRWMGEGLDTLKQLVPLAFELAKAFMTLAPIGQALLPQITKALENMLPIIPMIGDAAVVLGPTFILWNDSIMKVSQAFNVVKGTVEMVVNAVVPLINKMIDAINNLFAPIRALANIAHMDIPEISHIGQGSSNAPGGPAHGGAFVPKGTSIGAGVLGRTPLGTGPASMPGPWGPLPTAGLPPVPAGGYSVPQPPIDQGTAAKTYTGGGGGGAGGAGAASKFTGPMGTEAQFTDIAAIASNFGLVMTSGARGFDPSHPGSYHMSGEAGDFGLPGGGRDDPRMLAFAEYMRNNFGDQLKELIYSGPGFSGGMLNNGKSVADSFYGSELSGHHDHVHVAVTDALKQFGFVPDQVKPYGNAGPTPVSVQDFGSNAQSKLDSLFAPMAQDFGISGGLPGIAKWLTTFLGNLALAGAVGGGAFGPPGALLGGAGTGAAGAQGSPATSFMPGPSAMGPAGLQPPWSADWNAIAQKESGGNWGIDTGNGYQGGLQFAPSSWNSAGGQQYAPSANLASPYQQALTAEQLLTMQGPGAWPNTFTPGSAGPSPGPGGPGGSGWGSPGLPGMIPGAGGQGFMGAPQQGPGVGAAAGQQGPQGHAPGAGGWQPTGGGFSGLAAADMAGGMASMMPGIGTAAQMGTKLANRAIGFAGQAAAIGVQGLFETFLPSGSDFADPSKSWPGRLLGGIAGAKPASDNKAGQTAPPAKQVDPNTKEHGTGQGQPPGPLIGTMNYTGPQDDGQKVARDINRQTNAHGAGRGR